ncbi:hypothetical protein OsJ_24085 [Oryza sativa Japonica Group]|uniref:Uncharacterized protein n=1 Tax=Oryza sativa subsp. japonica TaxID=39947 RepID=A3BJB8_ORYSJ|nr:hypothetical protein OsJ_24085 [Oryza sativa Japonica Group]
MGKEVDVSTLEAGGARDYIDPPPAPLVDVDELGKWSLYRALIAEFVATLLFLYVTVATVIGYKHQTDAAVNGADAACGGVGVLGIAWAFGGMIFILVYCTAGVSGGHINPAVTLGLFLARKVSLVRALLYMAAQCLGAICGVALVKGFQSSLYDRYGGGANELAAGYSTGTGLAAEMHRHLRARVHRLLRHRSQAQRPRLTCSRKCINFPSICVCTLQQFAHCKNSSSLLLFNFDKSKVLAPLPIGFAVFMVHLATIPITGTGINPARSLGVAVVYNNNKAWSDQWIFWVGPFIGAAIAALYHQVILRASARGYGSFRSNA